MYCYFHGDVAAVAVCKACGRGICHDCSAEVGASMGCRNRCESEVELIDDLRRRSLKMATLMTRLYWGMGLGLSLIGLMTIMGSLWSLRSAEPNLGGVFFGGVFLAGGIGCICFALRTKGSKK
ncbi:MAG TPA: hypothetical protein VGM54_26265 [Chthoniobacter sp.]|jgi:hypothetical protein